MERIYLEWNFPGRSKNLTNVHTLLSPNLTSRKLLKTLIMGFPSDPVVKNLPTNAGDMGSSSGRGRSHMLQSNEARAP